MYFSYGTKELDYLSLKDENLAKVIKDVGIIKRDLNEDLFSAIIINIISQQISSKAGATIISRLKSAIDEITYENMLKLDEASLIALGISKRKVSYINDFIEHIRDGCLDLNSLKELDDQSIIDILTDIKGIGVWTAQMLLIFSLNRLDVLSYNDYGIKKGLCLLHHHDKITKPLFEYYQDLYHPYGTIASFYLWYIANNNLIL